MLLCVNANAAIDKTLVVPHFQLNAIHRPQAELTLPGGKGCNVARAAHSLGTDAAVLGWVGGLSGDWIERALHQEGIGTALSHTQVESRTCTSILDPLAHTITEIYESGRPVTPSEVDDLLTIFQEQLPHARMITLSGSLPPGAPPDLYARFCTLAHAAGVPIWLDSSGDALRAGWHQGHPDGLKCNRAELGDLLGKPPTDLPTLIEAVRDLSRTHRAAVVITLGAAGAVAAQPGADEPQLWLAHPPSLQTVSTVGSGDVLLAGMLCALLQGQTFSDALRQGIAASVANTLQIGAGRFDPAHVQAYAPQIHIAPLPNNHLYANPGA